MTHPQSPTSPLPEAAEPVAWQVRCRMHPKWRELPAHEVAEYQKHGWEIRALYAAPSPVAQAPAQAGEQNIRDKAMAVLWTVDNDSRKEPEMVALAKACEDFDLARLATPPAHPVLAPVVREPMSIGKILRIADEADLARDYNDDGDVQSTRHEDADLTEEVVNFARAIERAHGIQATTGEQSHG